MELCERRLYVDVIVESCSDHSSLRFSCLSGHSAKLVLGKALYEYVASGTDDEQSELSICVIL